MKKLTKTQIEVLRRLAEPGVVAHYVSGLYSYWFVEDHHIRWSTMENLIGMNLVVVTGDSLGYYDTATIAPAGRAALAAAEGKEGA